MSLALPVLNDDDGAGFDDWRWQLRNRITCMRTGQAGLSRSISEK